MYLIGLLQGSTLLINIPMALIIALAYLFPAIIAYKRNHTQFYAIAILCIISFFLPTAIYKNIAWLISLVWSFTNSRSTIFGDKITQK